MSMDLKISSIPSLVMGNMDSPHQKIPDLQPDSYQEWFIEFIRFWLGHSPVSQVKFVWRECRLEGQEKHQCIEDLLKEGAQKHVDWLRRKALENPARKENFGTADEAKVQLKKFLNKVLGVR